jgi:16S rRNA processing protein RimM
MDRYICVGKITGAHGIRGYVKVFSHTQDPAAIGKFKSLVSKDGKRCFELRVVSQQKSHLIVAIEGVNDRNAAEALRHTELYVQRELLPAPKEGSYYFEDLKGLRVELSDGSVFGKVVELHNYGAGDIIEILCDKTKRTEMFSFDEMTIPVVDLDVGRVVLNPPEVVMVTTSNKDVSSSDKSSS